VCVRVRARVRVCVYVCVCVCVCVTENELQCTYILSLCNSTPNDLHATGLSWSVAHTHTHTKLHTHTKSHTHTFKHKHKQTNTQVLDSMRMDADIEGMHLLKVDGGATKSDLLMQVQVSC